MPKSPTKKQIIFAEKIAATLALKFPESSRDFTRDQYSKFIRTHQQKYYDEINWGSTTEEDLAYLGLYENDAWCEHY